MTTSGTSTTLTVQLASDESADVVSVFAQMPERLRVSQDAPASGTAQAAFVSGVPVLSVIHGSAGWVERVGAAVASGARAVVLSSPEPVAVAEVDALSAAATAAGVLVAVDTPYAGSPAWPAARDRLLSDVPTSGVLDAVACIGPSESASAAFLAALAVVRPLLGQNVLASVHSGDDLVVAASSGTMSVTVTVVRSAGPRGLTLTLVGYDRRWRVVLPSDGTASPAEIARHDAEGAQVDRPRYESARRATLASVHAALTGGSADTLVSLNDLAADLRALPEATS